LPGQIWLVGVGALLLLPGRIIFEVNADWPLVAWTYTAIVVGLTLQALFLTGGWHWVRHFAFPTAFIFVALAWPFRIERAVTQSFMQVAAGITVEMLGVFGIPAVQRGNLIEVTAGVIGVEEACSGIRSFQSTLMAGLLMGELYRFRLLPRVALLSLGLVMAFGFNLVRTLFLTWQASVNGVASISKWHDSAGLTILVICFFALWLSARWMRSRWSIDSMESGVQTVNSQECSPATDLLPRVLTQRPLQSRWRVYLLALGLLALFDIVATEVWYGRHEANDAQIVRWSVAFPVTKQAYQVLELPPRTAKLLGYDSSNAAQWREDDGSNWNVYFFQWHGKSIQSLMAARYHRPEVCLPAAGLKQVSEPRTDYLETAGLRLPFQKASYSGQGHTFYVFYSIWQDGDESRKGMRSKGRADRLLGPIEGKRRFGQQALEIVTTGYSSLAEAEQGVRKQLPGLIKIEQRVATQSGVGN